MLYYFMARPVPPQIKKIDYTSENMTPYRGFFRTPRGTIVDNRDLSLTRFIYTGAVNPETMLQIEQRALLCREESTKKEDKLYLFLDLTPLATP